MKHRTQTVSSAVSRVERQLSSAWTRKEISTLEQRWLNACEKEFSRLFRRRQTSLERLHWRVAFLRVLARHIEEEVAHARKRIEIWGAVS